MAISPMANVKTLDKHQHGFDLIEGSLEIKLPTIWTDEKQRWEESERREE